MLEHDRISRFRVDPANPGATVKILKTNEEDSTVKVGIIQKYLRMEATLRDAQQDGTIPKANVTKGDAEGVLDELAVALQARDGGSAESAFAKAMNECPTLGSLALGSTTGNQIY